MVFYPFLVPTPYLATLLKSDNLVLKCKDMARFLQPTLGWMSTAAEDAQTVPYCICTYGGQLAGSFRFRPVVNLPFTLNLSKGCPFRVRQSHHERTCLETSEEREGPAEAAMPC